MRTSRTVCAVLVSMALAGCGIAQRMEAQEQAKKLAALSDAAAANCNTQIPPGDPKTAVARIKCLNDAMAIRMPTFAPDQDLAQAFMAERLVIAERVQTGKMTVAEGNAAIAEKWSRAVSESQARRNAATSVMAQQSAASAANTTAWASVMQATRPPPMPRPVTCLTTGSMTTCN